MEFAYPGGTLLAHSGDPKIYLGSHHHPFLSFPTRLRAILHLTLQPPSSTTLVDLNQGLLIAPSWCHCCGISLTTSGCHHRPTFRINKIFKSTRSIFRSEREVCFYNAVSTLRSTHLHTRSMLCIVLVSTMLNTILILWIS